MLAPQYPDVNFIIAHLGSNTDDFRAHQQVAYQLARYPNVFTETSGVRQYDYIVEAIKRAGPRKILFGSDGPWLHPGVEIQKIRLLGLPPEKEALILGGNISRLLRAARVGPKMPPITPLERAQTATPSVQGRSLVMHASKGYPPTETPL